MPTKTLFIHQDSDALPDSIHLKKGESIQVVELITEEIERKTKVALDATASYSHILLTMGPKPISRDIEVTINGETAKSELYGLSIVQDQAEHRISTGIEIASPRCESEQLFKSIITDKSRYNYAGLVHVHPDSQEINSDQLNRNLMLTENGKAQSEPQLQIYADDVSCTHGATTGQLEELELLYLRSRGLDLATARHCLIQGFCNEITDHISNENPEEKEQLLSQLKQVLANL